jgi:hypothetical protein
MAGNGLNLKLIDEIRRLNKLGIKNWKIAKALGVHLNTVNKYVEGFAGEAGTVAVAPGSLPVAAGAEEGSEWVKELDWEKIRGEYLQGVSLNVVRCILSGLFFKSLSNPNFEEGLIANISLTSRDAL